MADIQPIMNDQDFQRAFVRLGEIFDAEPGTPEGDERAALADLVVAYDDEHYPITDPQPRGVIEFWMDQRNLTLDDLIPCIGSPEVVTEVLAGEREVTPEMAQALYERLNIDVRDLLGEPTTPATGG